MLFFGSGSAHATKFRNVCRLYIGLRVRHKYYRKKHSRSGLAWSRPRAVRGLSRPTSVFRTTIGVCVCVCKILSRSVEIWQYKGQKTCFGVKTENGHA